MRNNSLAIVIPAYKIDFFKYTLDSLAGQTCKDFTLYIGDDCSPAEFKPLIERYKEKINIVYHRFDENLGGKNLVGHWKRCIELTHDEQWLWLFSDDDVLGERCVELFYNEIADGSSFDIYHFDVKIIDSAGRIVYLPGNYPDITCVEELYEEASVDHIRSFVVENIFSREIYDRVGGFEIFPLAWGSDMATWLKMAREKGMKSVRGDFVYWRRSEKNITPSSDRDIIKKKFMIQADFYDWVNSLFNTKRMRRFNKYVFFRYCVHYSNLLKYSDLREIMNYGVSKKLITPMQKCCTLPILPLLRVSQTIKAKIIKK